MTSLSHWRSLLATLRRYRIAYPPWTRRDSFLVCGLRDGNPQSPAKRTFAIPNTNKNGFKPQRGNQRLNRDIRVYLRRFLHEVEA
jgi:hypothetical protein